jgi:hypothetical protein
MVQVLLEGRLIELSQKLRTNADVNLTDAVDELTFVHAVLLFWEVKVAAQTMSRTRF